MINPPDQPPQAGPPVFDYRRVKPGHAPDWAEASGQLLALLSVFIAAGAMAYFLGGAGGSDRASQGKTPHKRDSAEEGGRNTWKLLCKAMADWSTLGRST